MSLSRPLRLFLLLLPLLGGLLLSMDWAGRQARQQALRAEGEQVRKQLDLYAGSLQTLIERFRSLPAVLALDPDLRAALAGPIDGELQQRLNLKLESINLAARSSTLGCSTVPGWPWRRATGTCRPATWATITVSVPISARPSPKAPDVSMRSG